jgi:hydrogenase expression/formation protein HypC
MTAQSRGGDPPIPPAPPAGGMTGWREPAGAECHDEVCVTCSDTAVQVRVLALLDDEMAEVDTGSGTEEVSVALVSAAVGDTILVHAREAIAVVPG